jgi:hypothetical protein
MEELHLARPHARAGTEGGYLIAKLVKGAADALRCRGVFVRVWHRRQKYVTAEPDEVCAFFDQPAPALPHSQSFDLAETARRVVHDLLAQNCGERLVVTSPSARRRRSRAGPCHQDRKWAGQYIPHDR